MKSIDYWNKSASGYAAKPVQDIPAYHAKLDYLRSTLSPDASVLELGCGSGSTAIALADSVSSWTGTDISSEMIRIAKAKNPPANVRFVEAIAEAEVAGGPFDAVCAFSLLHLVPDMDAVLERVRSHLKPGGLFVSKTACVGDMPLMMRGLARAVQSLRGVPELRFLRHEELVAQLQAHEFEILETRKFAANALSTLIVARV